MFSAEGSEKLKGFLEELESIYVPLMDSEEYHTEPLSEVIDNVFSYIETFEEGSEEKEFKAINDKAEAVMGQLSLLSCDASFYSKPIVVFDNFPNLLELSRFVFKLTKISYVNLMDSSEYKKILGILQYVDTELVEFKVSIPYRLFKLLFLMTCYKSPMYVSILSKFILNQVALAL